MTIEQIIDKVKKNNPKADLEMIKLAYEFALTAHKDQKRQTGEPYIQHSLHTAFILAQIKADLSTIIAGILHDVPEDTSHTIKEIEKDFGKEVAELVEGVTKVGKVRYRGVERYLESLRKMFLALSSDIRVILIKFADRLHNLRTLEALPPEKQRRIAQETMEIYAPIAGLLGIWRLKWQMEDLCFKHLYPEEFKKIQYKFEVEKKAERNRYIQKVKNILNEKLEKEKIKHSIEGRFKHLYSIFKKMQAKDRKFDEIYDVFALRVIVDSITDCYKTLGIIHATWKPKPERFKDYIALPKPNGYRSLHTTVYCEEGKATEFQIRTREMNEEAHYGIAAHWYYKQGFFDKMGIKQPRWIKEIIELQKNTADSEDFVKQVKLDIFQDRIFVFTPKGDVIDLPEDATPIDFAYAIHTDLGNKCVGSMVNNNMAPLDYKLKSGDSVDIVIDKNRKGPNHDWMGFVKTHKAREKIKQYARLSAFESIKKFIPRI